MNWAKLLWVLPICLLTGCTTTKLRNSTVSQAGSLTELQYEQVLNNLAMFCSNPEMIPSLVKLKDGSAQIADVGSASYMGDWYRAFKSQPTLLGSRTVVEQWGMSPVTDDNELELIGLAYKRAVGIEESLEEHKDLANDLAHEFVKQSPDIDDFRGSIPNLFEDFKNTLRDERTGDVSTSDPKTIIDYILNPASGLKDPKTGQSRSGGRDEFQKLTISSVDANIIFDNEIIRFLNIYGDYYERALYRGKEYYVNFYDYKNDLDSKSTRSKMLLSGIKLNVSRDGKPPRDDPTFYPATDATISMLGNAWYLNPLLAGEVWYITPEAAAARRQVKEIELDLLAITCERSWYGRGGKHDVPKDACFVGQYRGYYVWVCPAGMKDLSTLTIKTLKFSSLIKDDAVLTVPGPRYTPSSGFPSN